MGIGRRLKERRKELGLSVAATAKLAGLRPTTLYDLEREEQHSTTRLHALCKVLGLNPDWVETGRGSKLSKPEARPAKQEEAGRVALHGMQISTEEVEFGIEWGKLDEPAKSLIREQVMLLVASQIRKRREPKGEPAPVKPPKHN